MINEKLFDNNTKQHIFHYALIYTVYRHTLLPNEEFSVVNAMRHLERNRQLRLAECVIHVLEDRLTFSRTRLQGNLPFRSWVAYKEIVAINRNTKRNDMFVLSIHSIESRKRYYEVYRCKHREDINHIDRLIRQAMGDSEKIIRVDTLTLDDQSIDQSGNRPRTMANFAFENNKEDLNKEEISSLQSRSTSPIRFLTMNEWDQSILSEKITNVPMVQSVPPMLSQKSCNVQTSLVDFHHHRLHSQATQTTYPDSVKRYEAPTTEQTISLNVVSATMQNQAIPGDKQDWPASRSQMPTIVREDSSKVSFKSGLDRAPSLIYSGGYPVNRNKMQTIERDYFAPVPSRPVAKPPPPQISFADVRKNKRNVSFVECEEVEVVMAKPVRIVPPPVRSPHDYSSGGNQMFTDGNMRNSLVSAKQLSASMPAINVSGDYLTSPVERKKKMLTSLGSVTYLNNWSNENLISSQYGSIYMYASREYGLNYNESIAPVDNEQAAFEKYNLNNGRTNTTEYVYRF